MKGTWTQTMVERSRRQRMSYSMKGHMDPDYGRKVGGLKYSYSMKGHMDPDGGKVEGLKYPEPRLWWKGGGA